MKFSARKVNGHRAFPQGPHRAARRMSSAGGDLDESGCIKQVDAPSWAEKTIYFDGIEGRRARQCASNARWTFRKTML